MHLKSPEKCQRQVNVPEAGEVEASGATSVLPGCADPITWCACSLQPKQPPRKPVKPLHSHKTSQILWVLYLVGILKVWMLIFLCASVRSLSDAQTSLLGVEWFSCCTRRDPEFIFHMLLYEMWPKWTMPWVCHCSVYSGHRDTVWSCLGRFVVCRVGT